MPNWCHNKLTVTGPAEVLEEFVKKVADPEHGKEKQETGFSGEPLTDENGEPRMFTVNQPLSFDRIVPMPPELRVTSTSAPDEETKKAYESNLKKHGVKTWYDWAPTHWGTKWDANFGGVFMALGAEGSEVPDKRSAILQPDQAFYAFDTAWSPPMPVIEAASELWPDLKFELVWGEPGMGEAGKHVFVAGVETENEDLDLEDALDEAEMWF